MSKNNLKRNLFLFGKLGLGLEVLGAGMGTLVPTFPHFL